MEKLGKVEQAALAENGWHAIAVTKNRHHSGTLPNGFIAFVRNREMPEGVGRCGTAAWAINDFGVFFYSGSYDLSRERAMEDLNHKIIREEAS